MEDVLRRIQRDINKVGEPLELPHHKKGKRVKIICVKNMDRCLVTKIGQGKEKETCVSFNNYKIIALLHMNENMIRFLGFTKVAKDKDVFIFSRRSHGKYTDFEPRSIIVSCNVVQDTLLAGERFKLL